MLTSEHKSIYFSVLSISMDGQTPRHFSANLLLCSQMLLRTHLNLFQKTQATKCHSYSSIILC